MLDKNNVNQTKVAILNAALDMFSQKGYSAVSIRDICAIVKIKESTIYYHFKNKEAILNELLSEFENRSEALISQLYSSFSKITSGTISGGNFFSKIMSEYVDCYLAELFCNKVIRILFIDQLNNPKVQQLYSFWLFEKPLEIQQFVITFLNNSGIIKCKDAELEAEKFYAPVFFLLSRYLVTGELSADKIEKFKSSLAKHFEEFMK